MTKVMIGSARGDENGAAHGGSVGDQNGREVSMQEWYVHPKGWRTFRAKDPAAAARIAKEMRAACGNDRIGYDQYQRNTLYDLAARVNFDLSRVQTACETDCSALVRVCCAAAGIALPAGVYTGNLASALLATGAFDELTGDEYNLRPDGLMPGDIQVTKVKGHTVVVLTGTGESASVLKRGMMNSEPVRAMQQTLIDLGYSVGSDGADGDFGANTESALKRFQAQHGLSADGVYDEKTASAMAEAAEGDVRSVHITGGTVHVRLGPGPEYESLGIVRRGDRLPAPDTSGWIPVICEGRPGYVSRKYAELI